MAVGLNTGVPWVMCKQPDAPDPVVSSIPLVYKFNDFIMSFYHIPFIFYFSTTSIYYEMQINTCNGMRCGETFTGPNSPNKPAMWTENWTSL